MYIIAIAYKFLGVRGYPAEIAYFIEAYSSDFFNRIREFLRFPSNSSDKFIQLRSTLTNNAKTIANKLMIAHS